jgi:hypothetical protein
MKCFQIFCVANRADVLAQNLAASPDIKSGLVSLSVFWNRRSASSAYADAIATADAEYMVFAHQDVYLPDGWFARLRHAIRQLDALDKDWAVAGLSGVLGDASYVAHVWDSGLGYVNGGPFAVPVRVVSLDELALVVRRSSGVTFDPDLPNFHLYGTDIVLAAEAKGCAAYVIDVPAIHNSRSIHGLGRDYVEAYRYVTRKWRPLLPRPTVIFRLTASPLPLQLHRVRIQFWRFKWLVKSVFRPRPRPQVLAKPAEKAHELKYDVMDFAAYVATHPCSGDHQQTVPGIGDPHQ